MKHFLLQDMIKGWFVGDFDKVASRTAACEVAVKYYKVGDNEPLHHHRVATEITVVVSGSVRMCNRFWGTGDVIVLEPNDATSFEALADSVTVVVKLPSLPGDKFFGGTGQ